MPGHTPRRPFGLRVGPRALAVIGAGTAAAVGALMVMSSAAGASSTVKAQLSLSGVATADSPTGGSIVGIHPGDTVTLSASTVPTAGLDKLGLGSLVDGLLSSGVTYQVTADLSGLPGGAKDTVLSGKSSKSFTFDNLGTYNFTWSAQSVGLLGTSPISLDGNQLAQAGIKLNAKNQYVGQIVVSNNPPKGGISVQAPGVSVQPQLPGGITLPKIGLPGVTTPTIPTTVPNLGPTKTTPGKTSTHTTSPTVKNVLPVPALVVPPPGSSAGSGLGDYSSNSYVAPVSGTGSVVPASGGFTSVGGAQHVASKAPAARNAADPSDDVNLGSSPSSSGVPAVLAIVAMIALAAVAGTYARLFLLRKD